MAGKIKAYPQKCSGCRLCELICSQFQEGNINPHVARIRINKDETTGKDTPRICHQCRNAPCAKACPVNAITYDEETGAWIIDENACTACGNCVESCPFDAIHLHPHRDTAFKCNFCGGNPQCVQVCETEAIIWKEE